MSLTITCEDDLDLSTYDIMFSKRLSVDVIKETFKTCDSYCVLPLQYRRDKEIILEAIKINKFNYFFVPDDLSYGIDIVRATFGKRSWIKIKGDEERIHHEKRFIVSVKRANKLFNEIHSIKPGTKLNHKVHILYIYLTRNLSKEDKLYIFENLSDDLKYDHEFIIKLLYKSDLTVELFNKIPESVRKMPHVSRFFPELFDLFDESLKKNEYFISKLMTSTKFNYSNIPHDFINHKCIRDILERYDGGLRELEKYSWKMNRKDIPSILVHYPEFIFSGGLVYIPEYATVAVTNDKECRYCDYCNREDDYREHIFNRLPVEMRSHPDVVHAAIARSPGCHSILRSVGSDFFTKRSKIAKLAMYVEVELYIPRDLLKDPLYMFLSIINRDNLRSHIVDLEKILEMKIPSRKYFKNLAHLLEKVEERYSLDIESKMFKHIVTIAKKYESGCGWLNMINESEVPLIETNYDINIEYNWQKNKVSFF